MLNKSLAIVPLTGSFERAQFDCGEVALNNYLKHFASQHSKKYISKTFVAAAISDPKRVLGYYCLSASSISFADVPDQLQRKLPKYPIPVARLGRLAVDISAQGQGLGQHLLFDALQRCIALTKEIGISSIVVDAKHERANSFYLAYGFQELTSDPLCLLLPMQTILHLVDEINTELAACDLSEA